MKSGLKTKRLVLQPYVAGLVTDEHISWLNDPDVVKFSEQRHKSHTLESQHAYLNNKNENEHIWLIKDHAKDIGTITANIDPHNGVANMGILIGDKLVHGQGYATEAWKAVIEWLFYKCHVRKIECGTMHENLPMRALAVRCGMVCEAVVPQHFMLDGEPIGLAIYGRFKPEKRRKKNEGDDSKSALEGVASGD